MMDPHSKPRLAWPGSILYSDCMLMYCRGEWGKLKQGWNCRDKDFSEMEKNSVCIDRAF